MKSENDANANKFAKFDETVEELKRDYDREMKENSSQISKLKEKNTNLEEENEMLKAEHKDCANELESSMSMADAATSMAEKLRTKLDNREAELQQYRDILQKSQEENNRLKIEIRDLQHDLDLNGIIAERNRLKADLTIANESLETSMERNSKYILKFKRQEDKCKEYFAEIDKLKQDLAQSQNLNAELENAKKANEVLTSTNKELLKEARRLWDQIYGSSSDGQGSSKNESENDTSDKCNKSETDTLEPTPQKKKKC